ncbi:sulfate adenylyltransferase [Sulfoacidibacillus ferrooxidans]|uniref:Sulfate adenylyltransferase n=1 Tax=Sulfoacidibacillus ferrooxidans TaxID=2005001 RepID=A0A9X1VAT0_9BACL|nr:Sulfate adenylyltransferase [Sulfoacidibacillus ferrooxidans]
MTALSPHGGVLVHRRIGPYTDESCSNNLQRVIIDDVAISDLEQMGMGAFSPLVGFMDDMDYHSVVTQMRLANGIVWPLPIALPISADQAQLITLGETVLLIDEHGTPHATMVVTSKYQVNLNHVVNHLYQTNDFAHPGVMRTLERGSVHLGGPVSVFTTSTQDRYASYLRTPQETRQLFEKKGWKTIVGFQTRNPIHRAHEYIQKCALETMDGLFIHPLVGPTKADDVPAPLRMRAYETVIEHYYPTNRVALGIFTAAMRYAGPREAILHALVRKNFGCTHFIVGRDHAGVGNYYGTYDAQKIFSLFTPEEIGISPMFFDHAFYCKECGGMATEKTCPHDEKAHVFLSGTKVRTMLTAGIVPPEECTRRETARVLMEFYEETSASKHV